MAVSFGAFGAHGLADAQARAWVETGAQFQLPHAAALLALVALGGGKPMRPLMAAGGWALGLGSLAFAGALYALALGLPRGLAAVAPLGGTAMMLGWLALLFTVIRKS